MLPSPSCGSPPKWRGASWKFSTSTLTTTAWLVWRGAVAGGDDFDRRAARGPVRSRPRRLVAAAEDEPATPTADRGQRRRPRGLRFCARIRRGTLTPQLLRSLPARWDQSAELAYRIGAAARRPASWVQLLKFGLVGGSGYLINLAVFAVLAGNLGVHHAIAAVGAFCVAVTNNFLWNRHWTFGPGEGPAGFQAARFFAVSIASLAINLVVLEAPGLRHRGRRPHRPGDRRRRRDAVQLPRQQALDLRLRRRRARRLTPLADLSG